MAQIEVTPIRAGDPAEYRVEVREGGSASVHRVSVRAADLDRLTGGRASAEECLRASFRFLLEREPKESILSKFDLMVIGRYFPEYESTLPGMLDG